jgi:hypothetical protein
LPRQRFVGALPGGQGISKRILRRGQPAPQARQLPHRLTASACPAHHVTIIVSTPPPGTLAEVPVGLDLLTAAALPTAGVTATQNSLRSRDGRLTL